MDLINVGYSNYMIRSKIAGIISPDSAPVKRLIRESKKTGNLFDATSGHKTRSAVITDTNQIFLSALDTDTLKDRFTQKSFKIEKG